MESCNNLALTVSLLGILVFCLEVLYFGIKPTDQDPESKKSDSLNYLVRIFLNFLSSGLLYATGVFSSPIYYIPAASMTISFGLYLIGFLTKQPFKRSFLTFYVMLGTAVTVLPV